MDSRGPIEVALSTDLRAAPYSFALWDIHTGAQLVVFKGNKNNPISHCLKLVGQDYFITAVDNVLQIWSIFNKKCQDQKLFLPGRPSTLCISPCCNYLIVGISEMIYVWQIHSGNLLAHTQRHYQTVTVLRLNQDGTFLFSGGEDGLVLVWPFADLISGTHHTGALSKSASKADTGVNEPIHSWQHHSAPVTDIHVTNSGLCVTCSTDKTVNIYSFADGKRLHCVADWPCPMWSIAMNRNETIVFLGGQDGNIYELAISSLSMSLISNRCNNDKDKKSILSGHKDRITHLKLSMDGSMLISGSQDSTCKIWDVFTSKMLRDIKHQAPIANLVTLLVPDAFSLTSLTRSKIKEPLLVRPLKRNVYKIPRDVTLSKLDIFEEASTTLFYIRNKLILHQQPAEEHHTDGTNKQITVETSNKPLTNGISEVECAKSTSEDVLTLKDRLRALYRLSVDKVFQDAACESLKSYKELVDDIDQTVPLKTKSKKKKPQAKRKEPTSDNEEQQLKLPPRKVKKGSDLFV